MKNLLINGIKIYAPQSFNELIDYAVASNKTLIAVNAEKILHANANLKSLINNNIGYPDGIGAVWALQKKGCKKAIKIPGCELWLKIIEKLYHNKSFYFIGGTDLVINNTIKKIKNNYPEIVIKNYRNGYLNTIHEKQVLLQDILNTKPDVVFVAMGSPLQENLINELQASHAAVYQGLGGSFDVYTGVVKRAPIAWINNNLEWAYRLIKQPSRVNRHLHLLRFFLKLHLNHF